MRKRWQGFGQELLSVLVGVRSEAYPAASIASFSTLNTELPPKGGPPLNLQSTRMPSAGISGASHSLIVWLSGVDLVILLGDESRFV